jgi:Uncharacterized protein conserved in bacteria C-term(DUF2220)
MKVNLGKKKVTLDELIKLNHMDDYNELVDFIMENIANGQLKPIISSKTNGKKPALYNAYRVISNQPSYHDYLDELRYKIHPALNIDYYLKHPEIYIEDRLDVLTLSHYLEINKGCLNDALSMNERSFEIWSREKFLQKGSGKRILKNLGLSLESLNIYETTEPLVYYSHHKNTPQNILIIENKDTFYSMRRHLLNGHTCILGLPIGTLIYGGGKGIHRSFQDFTFCVEPYLNHQDNVFLYFGDLDYEGIIIYESLQNLFQKELQIIPFREGYEYMLKKAVLSNLPVTKQGQNKNIGTLFLDAFAEDERKLIIQILNSEKYIPQEILNGRDF